jgi:DNA/RNA endonuclease YhcR with UshA esterase domain
MDIGPSEVVPVQFNSILLTVAGCGWTSVEREGLKGERARTGKKMVYSTNVAQDNPSARIGFETNDKSILSYDESKATSLNKH